MLTAAISLVASGAARAHTVAVESPDRTDHALVESFSRLCGELAMYGLDVQPAETARAKAVGGVALVRSGGQLSARIWITAPAENDKVVRITITVADADAPTLLAIRAADVLRASLRDYRGLVLPPPAAAAAAAPAAPPAPVIAGQISPWTASASASMLLDPGKLGLGLAPSLELRRRLGARLFVMIDATGPVVGHGLVSSAGSAHIREALATVALAVRVADRRHAAFDLSCALGTMYFAVHGDAPPGWTAEDSSTWAGVAAAGVRLTVRLTSRLALSASSAALFILPRPVVDLGSESHAVGQPLLLSRLGLDLVL
jgi:hypothetical protein